MDSGLIDTTISFISCGHRSKYGLGKTSISSRTCRNNLRRHLFVLFAEKTPRKFFSTYIQQNSDVATKGVKCLNWYPCK